MPSAKSQSQYRPRVLLIEEERLNADTRALILNKSGFETTAAYDPQAAMKLAATWKPDVLICSVSSHGPSGVEIATMVCQNLKNCRVILLSGVASDIDSAAQPGACSFEVLSKPIHPQVLLDRLGPPNSAAPAKSAAKVFSN